MPTPGGAHVPLSSVAKITEQRGWQCGGGILNPPMSFVKTVQLCGITVKGAPDGAPVDQVFVKEGTYLPTQTTTRTISFAPINGVEIYGGYRRDAGWARSNDFETIIQGGSSTPART